MSSASAPLQPQVLQNSPDVNGATHVLFVRILGEREQILYLFSSLIRDRWILAATMQWHHIDRVGILTFITFYTAMISFEYTSVWINLFSALKKNNRTCVRVWIWRLGSKYIYNEEQIHFIVRIRRPV